MTDSLKYKLRGALYLLSGACLTISGIVTWDGLDYIWGTNYSIEGEAGSMHVTIIIIGLALMAASYFEFLNARLSRKNEKSDNKDL